MPAHYDNYDYKSYWDGREYEHESEVLAVKKLIYEIPEIDTALEIGAGFGRMAPAYIYRAKNIILSDPSSKLLRLAKNSLDSKKVKFIHSGIDNLKSKIKRKVDLIFLIRVMHHLPSCDDTFKSMNSLLVQNGYLVMEFANKRHFKAMFEEFVKGNLTFVADIFPIDIRSKKSKKKKTIPFVNFHPDYIFDKLEQNGFEVVKVLSVSNIRSSWAKKHLPLETLLTLEDKLQKPFGRLLFGPSVFVLARKKVDIT